MKYLTCLVIWLLCITHALAAPLIWNSQTGKIRFTQADKTDFYALVNFFETQSNGIYCGPTTAAIVLNALRINKVKISKDLTVLTATERKHLPASYNATLDKYTQRSVLTLYSSEHKTIAQILGQPMGATNKSDFGLQLRQYNKLLHAHKLATRLRIVNKQYKKKIRKEIIQTLKMANTFVLANYHRTTLGQQGGGHISPLGAYHEPSDSVLIMDVNPNKSPWVWVSMDTLITAMATYDTLENRGYIIVAEGV
jgi:hypothetical protein